MEGFYHSKRARCKSLSLFPVVNEAEAIAGCLAQFRGQRNVEVIVVDGGSRDGTQDRTRAAGIARLVTSPISVRSVQMNRGASSASGDVLLFLHVDTFLPEGAIRMIRESLEDPGVAGGSFRLGLSEDTWMFRTIAFLSTMRSEVSGSYLRRSGNIRPAGCLRPRGRISGSGAFRGLGILHRREEAGPFRPAGRQRPHIHAPLAAMGGRAHDPQDVDVADPVSVFGFRQTTASSLSRRKVSRSRRRRMTAARLGFVGLGYITVNAHLPPLAELAERGLVTLQAFCDTAGETAASQARTFGANAVYTDHREMFDKEHLDGVYICVPPTLHTDAELIAAEKGIPVMVEKPQTLDMAQAVRFSEAIRKSGVPSQVGFMSRYYTTAEFMRTGSRNGRPDTRSCNCFTAAATFATGQAVSNSAADHLWRIRFIWWTCSGSFWATSRRSPRFIIIASPGKVPSPSTCPCVRRELSIRKRRCGQCDHLARADKRECVQAGGGGWYATIR